MKFKFIKFKISSFIISYVFLCGIIFFISYKFFLHDFILIEKEQNKNNIETFLNSINKNIESLKNTTNDYSKWDDTYEFMKDRNEQYIYENFREGSQTLIEINLDSIIYINKENKIIYSQYSNEYLKLNKDTFETYLIENFKDSNNINTIINFNSKFLYLFKSQVKQSDKTGENVGYILTAKLVDDDFFSKKYSIFKNIHIENSSTKLFDINIDLEYLNAKIYFFVDSNYLKNYIEFFDEKNEYIISLVTTSERTMINNSKHTIVIFNLIVCFIMLFVFFFIYKNQYLINNQNIILNKRVAYKTRKLNTAYQKLDEKNKELYELVNIDTLTKIRNRRSYFNESSKLLKKTNENNKNLFVAIIDIDDFKKVNDKYGHAIGDEVLVSFCSIVNNMIDEEIIFGRIGGEEFCLTFYDKGINEISAMCEQIREKCAKNILNIQEQSIIFTISMGLSIKKSENEDIDKILQRADLLLYEAKKSGKNRVIKDI